MRRSASEVIRELDSRIARLEGKTANSNRDFKILADWFTGSPRDDERHQTLSEIVDELVLDIGRQHNYFKEELEAGEMAGVEFYVSIDIGGGVCQVGCGANDGYASFQAGCSFCVWEAFVACGAHRKSFKDAAKILATLLRRNLSNFGRVYVDIGTP